MRFRVVHVSLILTQKTTSANPFFRDGDVVFLWAHFATRPFFLSKSEKIAVFAICACSQVGFEVYQEIMLAKRTPITQQEKEKMWQLYNELVSFPKLAKKLNRSPDTVSRYVHEYEAAVNAVCVVIDAQNT